VYADSQTPVSADGFRFSDGDRAAEFERGLTRIEGLVCDLLITPHPGASDLWARLEARDAGDRDALLDGDACRRYAADARDQLARRLERERPGG
jgi:metallo-beta-lactamase class B